MSRVAMLLIAIVTSVFSTVSGPRAEESEPEGARSAYSRLGRDTGRGVFFSAFDAAERDRSFGWGFKYAPLGRLDTAGWRFMTSSSLKMRDADAVSGTRYNRVDVARALADYEWRFAGLSVSAFAGGSLAILSPDTANALGRRGRIGPAGAIELWQDWGDNGVYGSRSSSMTLIVDQAARSLYVKLRHGFSTTGVPAQFGPELSLSAGSTIRARGITVQSAWQKYRMGLHISEIPFWRLRLGASAGAEIRQSGKSSGYINVASYIRY